jgi:hypothetical protein
MNFSSQRMDKMSKWLVGSSSSKTSGPPIRQRLLVGFDGDPQAFQNRGGARFERVTVVRAEQLFELGELSGVSAVVDDAVALLECLPDQAVAHHGDVQNQRLIVEEVVLAQDTDPRALRDVDRAAGRGLVTGDDADEGGLARAVGAH